MTLVALVPSEEPRLRLATMALDSLASPEAGLAPIETCPTVVLARILGARERREMWVSTRETFRADDPGWAKYISFIGLPRLTEVRTVDPALNPYVDRCGSLEVAAITEIREALAALPRPERGRAYYQLSLDPRSEPPPPNAGFRPLGHDLLDETHTSSLLNCGPWTGRLAPFTERLNQFGLLTLADARLAKALLPEEWPGEPHAAVTVWALYEVEEPQ